MKNWKPYDYKMDKVAVCKNPTQLRREEQESAQKRIAEKRKMQKGAEPMKTNTIQEIKTGRDANGNKTAKIKTCGGSFSIQTLGNMPKTHREGVYTWSAKEVNAYVKEFGTDRQKALCDIGNSVND